MSWLPKERLHSAIAEKVQGVHLNNAVHLAQTLGECRGSYWHMGGETELSCEDLQRKVLELAVLFNWKFTGQSLNFGRIVSQNQILRNKNSRDVLFEKVVGIYHAKGTSYNEDADFKLLYAIQDAIPELNDFGFARFMYFSHDANYYGVPTQRYDMAFVGDLPPKQF